MEDIEMNSFYKGQASTIINILIMKLGELSENTIESITQCDPMQLELLSLCILEIDSENDINEILDIAYHRL